MSMDINIPKPKVQEQDRSSPLHMISQVINCSSQVIRIINMCTNKSEQQVNKINKRAHRLFATNGPKTVEVLPPKYCKLHIINWEESKPSTSFRTYIPTLEKD